MVRACASKLKCIFKSGSTLYHLDPHLGEMNRSRLGSQTTLCVCVCKRTWSDIVKQAWLVVAVVVLQLSSRVQLFATPWTAACQASCHPLSSPSPPTFNLSRIRVFCHVKYSFWKKKGLGICKTSQFAPYFTIQKIYFHHLRGKT